MKKLVFGLIATVVFGSFSYGQEFKSLYENYKQSSKTFYSKLAEFENSLKLETNDVDIFKDSEIFRDWIEKNVSKTNYQNSNEAINEYNQLITQQEALVKNNLEFFKQVADNKNELLHLLEVNPLFENVNSITSNPNYTTNSSCINDCINDAVDCNRGADENYAAGIGSSAVGAIWNPIVGGAAALYATIVHHNAIRRCVRGLSACTGGC